MALAVMFFASAHTASASASTPLILGDATSHPLSGHWSVLIDSAGELTLQDILQPHYQDDFQPLVGSVRLGYTRDTVWARLTLHATADFSPPGYLRLGAPYLDYVNVYLQTGPDAAAPEAYQLFELGDRRLATDRPVRHPNFIIPFTPSKEEIVVYVQVRSSSAIDLFGAVHNQEGLNSHSYGYAFFHSGYLAITLIIALINLVHFLRIRESIFVWYSFYALALFAIFLGNTGVVALLLPGQAHLLSDHLVGGGAGLSFCFFAFFGISLFESRRRHPAVHYFLLYLALYGLLLALAPVFDLYSEVARLMPINGLLSIMVFTVLSIHLVRRGEVGGRIYLLAFSLGNIGYAVTFLQLMAILPTTALLPQPSYAMQITTVIQMVLMSLALTERLHAAERRHTALARAARAKEAALAREMTLKYRHKEKELEASLEREKEALRRQVDFIELITHEYRTPLAVIRANLDLLRMKARRDGFFDQLQNTLSKMEQSVARLVEVMDFSLAHRRLDSDRQEVLLRPLDLRELLTQTLSTAEELHPGRQWQTRLPAEPLPALVDAPLLKTAILILIDNACKYSPADAPVEIILQQGRQDAEIVVRDHGSGLTAAERQTVFHRFKRGVEGKRRQGAGLGLYLCRLVVEQHKGRVVLNDAADGHGVAAFISLPLSAQQD